jgi:hypothetical protein
MPARYSSPLARTRVTNAILEAVQQAKSENLSVKDFLVEAEECWVQELEDDTLVVKKSFSKAIQSL